MAQYIKVRCNPWRGKYCATGSHECIGLAASGNYCKKFDRYIPDNHCNVGDDGGDILRPKFCIRAVVKKDKKND